MQSGLLGSGNHSAKTGQFDAVDQGEIPTSLAKPNVYLVASVASDQSGLASFRKGLTGAPEWSLQEGWPVVLAWRMEGWSEGL